MSDNLDSAVNSLSEQTKKLEIAQFFTHGDMMKAKSMVAGSYKDLHILKMRFSSSSVYGALILFLNTVSRSVYDAFAVVSQSFEIAEIKTNQNWMNFETDIQKFVSGEYDPVLGNHVREELTKAITMEVCTKIKTLMDNSEDIALNHMMQKILQDRSGFQNVDITVDYEATSSLEMELKSKLARKIDPREIEKERQKEEERNKPKDASASDSNNPLAGKEVRLVLQGSLILSPIKGKDIAKLVEGDKIRISVIDKNPKAVDLLKAFSAYTEEGERKPITGRIISIKFEQGAGYVIFAVVAKGIYIRIDEEEDNIKVAMDPVQALQKEDDEARKGSSLPIIIVLVVVFLFLVGIVISFLV